MNFFLKLNHQYFFYSVLTTQRLNNVVFACVYEIYISANQK